MKAPTFAISKGHDLMNVSPSERILRSNLDSEQILIHTTAESRAQNNLDSEQIADPLVGKNETRKCLNVMVRN